MNKLKIGDTVWAKHPIHNWKTMTGVILTMDSHSVVLKHKDGTQAKYPLKDVSLNYNDLHPNPYGNRKTESIEFMSFKEYLSERVNPMDINHGSGAELRKSPAYKGSERRRKQDDSVKKDTEQRVKRGYSHYSDKDEWGNLKKESTNEQNVPDKG